MIIWLQNEKNEQYKFELFTDSEQDMNDVLDQLNIAHFDFITENDFNIPDPMTIDVMDKSGNRKIGELTCKNINL